jgi:Integrase core domain
MPDESEVAQALIEFNQPTAQTISRLSPYKEQIEAWRKAGVNMLEVCRRLNGELKVKCSYAPVWHYVTTLEGRVPEVTLRVETEAGEEGQVDFGYAGKMWDPLTRRMRKAWLFVMTLSWSRHQYVVFVFDQKIETWLGCHVKAFAFFGGVPRKIKIDNLKAAIVRASLDDPQVQRSYRECAEHYGFLISPCRVATPQHKGKVEAGVKYIKGSFLPGRNYTEVGCNVTHANADVVAWIKEIAGQRIHGTTRQKPMARFEATEQALLQPLPEQAFDPAVWTELKCHRDGYVVFEHSYYSVPFRWVEQRVSVRVTAKSVELHMQHERIATHSRAAAPGQRLTLPSHLPPYKALGLQPAATCRERASVIGPYLAQAVGLLLSDSVVDRHSAAIRLVRLADQHDATVLEQACQQAFELGDLSPPTIRDMLKTLTKSQPALSRGLTSAEQASTQREWPVFARSAAELVPMASIEMAVAA